MVLRQALDEQLSAVMDVPFDEASAR
eukprot:SAG31_NODE_35436_length_323_cov_0.696429_1_plen_25_part_10